MVELFIALTPREPAVLRLALSWHNDALHLARECLTLVLPYHAGLSPAAATRATMVGLRAPLLALARTVLSEAVGEARAAMLETLEQANGLLAVGEDTAAGERARAVSQRIARQLAALSDELAEHLTTDAAATAIALAAEPVLAELVRTVLSLRHISEKDSHELCRVVETVTTACEALLDGGAAEPLPSVARSRQVQFVLGSRLTMVVEHHEKGALAGLRPVELISLMRALWTEEALLNNARSTLKALAEASGKQAGS
jgi:hypothetical protein